MQKGNRSSMQMLDSFENRLLKVLLDALRSIEEPRLYATERGYQGRLVSELHSRLAMLGADAKNAIVEQEYQKSRSKHGISKRPDVIIHVPYEHLFTRDREAGNHCLIQIKRRASRKKAFDDLATLETINRQLSYSMCVFLNLDSDMTFSELCPRSIASHTHCIATTLEDGAVKITHNSCANNILAHL